MNCNKCIICAAVVSIFAGCGGASDNNGIENNSTIVSSSSIVFGGTAATGLAISGGAVAAQCVSGAGTTITNNDGTYTITVPNGIYPCVIEVSNVAGDVKLHSLANGSSTKTIVNVTSLTELLSARVLRQDPTTFFSKFDVATMNRSVTAASMDTAQSEVIAALAGNVDASNIGNFVNTYFKATVPNSPASGDALDKVLDQIKVKLTQAQFKQISDALTTAANVLDIPKMIQPVSTVPGGTIPAANTATTPSPATTTTTITPSAPTTSTITTNCTNSNFTAEKYNAITLNMTLAQVTEIIGCNYMPGTKVNYSNEAVSYSWGTLTQPQRIIGVFFDGTGTYVKQTPDNSGFKQSSGF